MHDEKPEVEGKFPESDPASFGAMVAKVAANIMGDFLIYPGVGTATAGMLDLVVGDPVRRRQAAFCNMLAAGIADLQQRVGGFDYRTLGENEEFVTVVAFAVSAAARTHREAKRQALCNAALNMAVGNKLNDILLGSFLSLVDRYTVHHIAVARILADPRADDRMMQYADQRVLTANFQDALGALFPDLSKDELFETLRDINVDGITQANFPNNIPPQGLLEKQTTTRGDAFIQFISFPIPEQA